jgi:hypothetical protein
VDESDPTNAIIRSMWLDKQSSGRIADVTGLTRSAVMGRVRRLGLQGLGGSDKSGYHNLGGPRKYRTKYVRPTAASKRKPKPKKLKLVPAIEPVPDVIHKPVYGTFGESIPWAEARHGHCKALTTFQHGTHPDTWRSCACQRVGETSYCEGHSKVFRTVPGPRTTQVPRPIARRA